MEQIVILDTERSYWENQLKELQQKHKEAGSAMGETVGMNYDWHDKLAFDDAQTAFEIINKKLRAVIEIIENASTIKEDLIDGKIVTIGTRVSVIINNTEEKEFHIGGYQTPLKNHVSYNAPIIKPLIGKGVWDIEDVIINGQQKKIEIIDIQKI